MNLSLWIDCIAAFEQQLSDFEERIAWLEAENQKLRQKDERRCTSLAEAAPVGIFRANREGEFIYVNERWCQIAGIHSEQAQGTGWIHSLYPADRTSVLKAWHQTTQEGQLFQKEFRFLSPDGRITWVVGIGGPETDVDGEVIGYIGSLTDISDYKQMEQALRASEDRLQEAQKIAHIGSWESDSETGVLLSWSAETYRIFEVDPDSRTSVNDIFIETLHPDDRNSFYHQLAEAIQNKASFEMVHRLKMPDQRIKYVQSKAQIFYNRQGEAIRVVGTIQDITIQRLTEIRLKTLIEGTATVVGADFFSELVRHAANALGVRCVLIAEAQKSVLMPLAWWVDGQLQANQRLLSVDVPYCAKTLRDGLYCIRNNIQSLYPNDPLLEALNAESYLGIRLKDSQDKPIGTLCILDDCPLTNPRETQGILRAFAARAGAELERLNAVQKLEQLNVELERKVAQRTAKLQDQETQLRELSSRLALSLQSGAIGYWEWDVQKNRLGWDELMYKLYGHEVSELNLTFDHWLHCLHPDDREATKAEFQQVVLGVKKKLDLEFRVTLPDKNHRVLKAYGFLVSDERGEPKHLVGISFDISDRKKYEEHLQHANSQLAQATRLKDEVLAHMGLELRTPLNVILGMAEGLSTKILGPLNHDQYQAVKTVEQSSTHLLTLITDILDLSKLESGHLDVQLEMTPIQHLCDTSLSFVRKFAFTKEIQLTCNIPDVLQNLNIYVDELRVRQVLINLLDNAVKFTPQGGKVTLAIHLEVNGEKLPIDASPPQDTSYRICFTVCDSGIGIAPQHLERLFQSFVPIESNHNRQYAGTGLGLILVKQLVELHHGRISVQSQVGEGSCFSVYFPCGSWCDLTQPLENIEQLIGVSL